MSGLLNMMNKKAMHETVLHVKLTKEEIFINGEWNKEELLGLLKNKLMKCNQIKTLSACNDARCDDLLEKLLHSIIHNGIYYKSICLELKENGLSSDSIIKAMKYGLLSLSSEELEYFKQFGVQLEVIRQEDMWVKKFDLKLICKLIITGLTKNQCWNIIMCGLMSQNENILHQLSLNGIDILSILNWQEIKPVTIKLVSFLRMLGINEDDLHYIEDNYINNEIEDMLIDLGYNEYKEKQDFEIAEVFEIALKNITEILYENNITILESDSIFLEHIKSNVTSDTEVETFSSCNLDKKFTNNSSDQSSSYTCCLNLMSKQSTESRKRKNYLRQNVMVPLSWAIGRTIKYLPSDPIYYIAYQLLRWRYGNVSQKEINNALQFVVAATIRMDRKLVERYKREELSALAKQQNKTIKKNIGYDLYRIEERCWIYKNLNLIN